MIALLLEHVQRRSEFVDPPEGRVAVRNNLQHGKPLVVKSVRKKLEGLLKMKRCGTRDKSRAGCYSQVADIKGRVNIPCHGGNGFHTQRGGRRMLATRHAVGAVVNHHRGDIDVASGGVNEMISTNSHRITITHKDNDFQMRLGELDPRREGERTSVCGMQCIAVQIHGDAPGATDA